MAPEVYLAEGEGSGRVNPTSLNTLRPFSSAQNARNSQILSSRYKSSTADSVPGSLVKCNAHLTISTKHQVVEITIRDAASPPVRLIDNLVKGVNQGQEYVLDRRSPEGKPNDIV
jgi:hypothetical protein